MSDFCKDQWQEVVNCISGSLRFFKFKCERIWINQSKMDKIVFGKSWSEIKSSKKFICSSWDDKRQKLFLYLLNLHLPYCFTAFTVHLFFWYSFWACFFVLLRNLLTLSQNNSCFIKFDQRGFGSDGLVILHAFPFSCAFTSKATYSKVFMNFLNDFSFCSFLFTFSEIYWAFFLFVWWHRWLPKTYWDSLKWVFTKADPFS